MKRALIIGAAALAAGFYLGTPAAHATETPAGPSFATCSNLTGWYANADEQADLPTATEDGLLFENKDLIHHATSPIDLADMDKVSASFVTTTAGKVVFKVETSSPYSTIITNSDGKLWSTAMSYDQEGGQGHPIDKYSQFVDLATKPGKAAYTSASMVVTFGVGYWVAEGDTVVSSISFHGTNYPLTCKPPVVVTSSPTIKPSHGKPHHPKPSHTKPSHSHPTTAPTTTPTTAPTTTPTTAPTAQPTSSGPVTHPTPDETSTTGPIISDVSDNSSLPKTGPSMGLFIGGGLAFLSRRRKVGFEV